MPNANKHTETYTEASRNFADVGQGARQIEKRALALKIIADNLLAKAEEETTLGKLKRKIAGD